MENINPIIQKIKALLQLSKGSANIEEANAALQIANKLIDAHRLSQAELEYEQQEPVTQDEIPIYESGRSTLWKSKLSQILSDHYGCTIINLKGYRKNSYTLIGRKSDMEIVRYMYAWLVLEAERLSHNETKRLNHNKSAGRIFCASYCLGFVNGLKYQLDESRKQASIGATSQALVKINSRLEEAQRQLKVLHPSTVKSLSFGRRFHNEQAYDSGKQKGQNIHLGAALNKASGIKLLGN